MARILFNAIPQEKTVYKKRAYVEWSMGIYIVSYGCQLYNYEICLRLEKK